MTKAIVMIFTMCETAKTAGCEGPLHTAISLHTSAASVLHLESLEVLAILHNFYKSLYQGISNGIDNSF